MTEPAPTSPFRRFPWIQLVFCFACLGVAAWLWMAYSYAWDAHARAGKRDPGHAGRVGPRQRRPWGYVRVRGTAFRKKEQHDHKVVLVRDGRERIVAAWVSWQLAESIKEGDEVSLTGDLTDYGFGLALFEHLHAMGVPVVRTGASRFHGASIAGLVVGAMGCFNFGLYLRTWLGNRKPLARQPGQDMIA